MVLPEDSGGKTTNEGIEDPAPEEDYAPPPPAAETDLNTVIAVLAYLGALKAQGLITDEELNAQRAELLGIYSNEH